jgi:serine/threonine protein kinase
VIVDRGQIQRALPHYELGEELGRGGFGLVLAARHRALDRQVAVKVMGRRSARHPSTAEDEARLLARIDHDHVVRVYELVEDGEQCLLVMELLDGGRVDERVCLPQPPPDVCAVGVAVAEALAAVHAHGMLHRDVTPANILCTRAGTPKVTDFGVAKAFRGSGTDASRVLGSPAYMAPEQFTAGRLGPGTDLYALGVVLHELLTGQPMFGRGLDPAALMHYHRTIAPPPLTTAPPPLAEAIFSVLEKDIRDRPADALAFAVRLAAVAAAIHPGWPDGCGIRVHLDDRVRRALAGNGTPGPPRPADPAAVPPGDPAAVPEADPARPEPTREDRDRARHLHNEAVELREDGRAGEALRPGRDALELRRRVRGPDDPDTLDSAANLAIILREAGDAAAAVTLGEDTLRRFQAVLGTDHPDTLRCAHNTANTRRVLGDVTGALELAGDTLARRRRALGDDDPDTLRSAHHLAIVRAEAGDAAAARALGEDTLVRRRRTLGDDDPDTLRSAHNLAIDRGAAGDTEGAAALIMDTLARRQRVLGAEHVDTLETLRAAMRIVASRPVPPDTTVPPGVP